MKATRRLIFMSAPAAMRQSSGATPAQRAKYEIGGGGVSLHWPDIDEDLSIAGLMAGVDRLST